MEIVDEPNDSNDYPKEPSFEKTPEEKEDDLPSPKEPSPD